jgi:AbrB family looped-hinge helix DNA binding protein
MKIIRLSSKNQIVLPREARDAMGLKGRDELQVVVKGNLTIIMPKPKGYCAALSGLGKGIYGRNYLKKERAAYG